MYYRIGAVHTLTGGRRTLETQLSASDKSEIWVNSKHDTSIILLYLSYFSYF